MSTEYAILGRSDAEDIYAFSNADAEVVLAHISDYGRVNLNASRVAALVKGFKPDAIITSGDNSQTGLLYDQQVGGNYPWAVERNLIYPSPGNHDYEDGTGAAYLEYFEDVVANRFYYKAVFGPVAVYLIDSNSQTPDGNTVDGAQYDWLVHETTNTRSPWNIVAFHHSPYTSSAVHGATTAMRWGYGAMGADLVLTGHTHLYDRLYVDTNYVVAGTGGSDMYAFGEPDPYSIFRQNTIHGAGLVKATPTKLTWEWYGYDGALMDTFTLEK
jgi:tartrate-resistant acid phosphatase type 5